MKKIPFVTLCFVMFAMSGCGIYSSYERPDVSVADSLYQNLPEDSCFVVGDSASLAFVSWRELFADTLLHDWIEIGLAHNTDLQISRLRIEQAEAALKASRLAFLPSATLSAQGNISSFDGGEAKKTYSISPSASWELDLFGKQRNASKGVQAALEQSRAYQQAVQTRLVTAIADSYYTLLMLDEQLHITKRTLNTWQENIRTLEALKRAGKTNEAAVLQAKANKLKVEASALTLEKQIIEQENSVSALLGVAPVVMKRGRLSEQVFPDKLSIGVPIQLLSNRPDVREAEWTLAQSVYAINVARAAFYPSIVLGGSAGWTNSGGGAITNPGEWLLSAVGSLVQPLFNRGTNMANLRIAESRRQEALLAFRQSLLDAGLEVNNSLIKWQTARRRLAIDKKQIVNLKAAVWNTRLLMKHGGANYLEVLTAQQNLLQAELAETTDRYEEIQGVITLFHALGGGVK